MKISNLIFTEHEKLLKTDSIQKEQINSLKEAVQYSLQLDTLYENKEKTYKTQVQKLEKKNKTLKFWRDIFGGSCIISTLFAVVLLL